MPKTCNSCGTDKAPASVPYVVHESDMARAERHTKRLWIALIIAVVMIFISNALWLWAWMQYDYTSEEQIIEAQQDGEGINIVGGGNVDYGAKSENNNT